MPKRCCGPVFQSPGAGELNLEALSLGCCRTATGINWLVFVVYDIVHDIVYDIVYDIVLHIVFNVVCTYDIVYDMEYNIVYYVVYDVVCFHPSSLRPFK